MKDRRTKEEVQAARNQVVAQDNDFIRHSRNKMTAMELNIVLFLISKIKPGDTDLLETSFTVSEFCQLCGLDTGGKDYRAVKGTLKTLADKSGWVITSDGGELLVRWIDYLKIMPKTGVITVRLSQTIKPFLIGLRERGFYNQAQLVNYLAMKSIYSKRLYEVLKSYTSEDPREAYKLVIREYEIGELKKIIGAEQYKLFADFQRRALEPAMREINALSDIEVSYNTEKRHGRATSHIIFSFRMKKPLERMASRTAADTALDGQGSSGQE